MPILEECNSPLPNDYFIPGCLYKWSWNKILKQFNGNKQPFSFLFIEATFGSQADDIEQMTSIIFDSANKGKTFLHPKPNSIFLCTNIERKQAKKSMSLMWKVTFLFEELAVFDIIFDEKNWQGRWEKIV